MNKTFTSTMSFLLLTSFAGNAEEKYNHFPSLNAETTSDALCNLTVYNERLKELVNRKSLTPEDMVKVHELTYTLENAVIKLKENIATIAVDLEKVHKGSEHLDQEKIKKSGEKYLAATSLIIEKTACP